MSSIRNTLLAALAGVLLIAGAVPATVGAAPPARKPVPSLSVSAAYTQFVSARAAFVHYRAFANPALVRWGMEGTRYLRVGPSVVDFKAVITFDIATAEGAYVPAERAALWVRVRRYRAPNGRIRTTWYDAHGGKGFERTPITNLLPA
jgi:hypothetical protein